MNFSIVITECRQYIKNVDCEDQTINELIHSIVLLLSCRVLVECCLKEEGYSNQTRNELYTTTILTSLDVYLTLYIHVHAMMLVIKDKISVYTCRPLIYQMKVFLLKSLGIF